MTGILPRGTDLELWMCRNRNSRVQAWLSVVSVVVLAVGFFVLLNISGEVGLYQPAHYIPYGSLASLEGVTGVLIIACGGTLLNFRVHDGEHY